MTLNDKFFVDFGKEPDGPARAHEMRFPAAIARRTSGSDGHCPGTHGDRLHVVGPLTHST